MVSKNIIFTLFLFTSSVAQSRVGEEPGFGKLIKDKEFKANIRVNQIKIESIPSPRTRCFEYEDNNHYDGNCLDYRQYCEYKISFSSLINDVYSMSDLSIFDSSLSENTYNIDCMAAANQWQAENATDILLFESQEKIYQKYNWNWEIILRPQRVCYQSRIVRSKIHLNGFQIFPYQRKTISMKKVDLDKCDPGPWMNN